MIRQASKHQRIAFTLVEVLAVLVVMSIMAGMVLTAIQGVGTTAKAARTRTVIALVDSVIQERYDSYKYRPLSVELPDLYTKTPTGSTIGWELLSTESARVRMLMIRDLQRMELPDRLSDIASAPTVIKAAASVIERQMVDHDSNPITPDIEVVVGTRSNNLQRESFLATWFDAASTYAIGGHNVPAKLAAFRDRIPVKKSDGTLFNLYAGVPAPDVDPSPAIVSVPIEMMNQGAECLYLIMATSFVGGQPAIANIPATNIGDTDGDGLLEILDGWGQPLGFIRWPVGYNDPQRSIDATVPDEFDPFRSDFAYVSIATDALATDVNYVAPDGTDPLHPFQTTTPWSMRPLIVSAGSDGEFGIALNPWSDASDKDTEQTNYSYRNNANWNIDSAHMGVESGGRDVPAPPPQFYHMIDPHMRNFVTDPATFLGLLIGQDIPGSDAEEHRADNITNFALQSEQ